MLLSEVGLTHTIISFLQCFKVVAIIQIVTTQTFVFINNEANQYYLSNHCGKHKYFKPQWVVLHKHKAFLYGRHEPVMFKEGVLEAKSESGLNASPNIYIKHGL